MKNVLWNIVLIACCLNSVSNAQLSNTKDSITDQLEWHISFDKAIESSFEKDKPVFAYFTGSDWCGYCNILKSAVLSNKTFLDWAEDNVILLELDYPKKKIQSEEIIEQNKYLLELFKIRGYPVIVLFDAKKDDEGKIVLNFFGKTGMPERGNKEQMCNDVINSCEKFIKDNTNKETITK